MTISPPGLATWFIQQIRAFKWTAIDDLGCGAGWYGMLFRIHNIAGMDKSVVVGMDLHVDDVAFGNWYDVIERMDINDIYVHVFDKDADCIALMEVIEHLAKEQGDALLDRIAASNAWCIMSTPVIDTVGNHPGAKPGLAHLHAWTPAEIKEQDRKSVV